jgi:putative ABC transport system permease protein
MRFALRQLAKSPGFTVTALVTLALGIGVNTTAFTILDRLMLQALPFHDPSMLVQVWSMTLRDGRGRISPADYFDLRDQNTVFTGVAAYNQDTASYAEPGKAPIQVGSVAMTANCFAVLGIRPKLGRTPSDDESKKLAHVCLISDWFWRQYLQGDPDVVGRTIRLSGRTVTIIGVMPSLLDDPALFGNRPGVFGLDPVTHSRTVRFSGWYKVAARMKPGVSIEQAQADMNVVAKRLAHDYPETNRDREFGVVPYPTNQVGDDSARFTWMTVALSSLVLLIACINLANLQIVRAAQRSHEVAIRLALGCPQRRLVGMFLLESVIIAMVGGALGVVVAMWSNAFVSRYLGIDMPIDSRVVLLTFLASFVTALLFGAAPAWLATRTNVSANLKSSGRGSTTDRARHWLRQGLVLVQFAMALTLLAGAGFFISGIYRLTHRDLGWNTNHEIIGVAQTDNERWNGDENRGKLQEFGRQVLVALRGLPGVQFATLSNGSPSWGTGMVPIRVEGRPAPETGSEPRAGYFTVSPDWFAVFGMRLIEGRGFTEADRLDSRPVAIVSESMARNLWPGESAIGRRFANAYDPKKPQWAEVVGVMADFKGGGEFYNPVVNNFRFLRPWDQDAGYWFVFAVRTTGLPGPLKESVRKAFGVLMPDFALSYLATIDEDTAGTLSYFTFLRRILVQIAALGLLLSAIGIYGVVANLAAERTKEIGIRMALGAQPISVLWLFVRKGLVLISSGAALGLIGAYVLVTILGHFVPALPGKDPMAILGAAGLLVGVGIFAIWVPARRTTKVDPILALRVE